MKGEIKVVQAWNDQYIWVVVLSGDMRRRIIHKGHYTRRWSAMRAAKRICERLNVRVSDEG